MTGLSNIRLFAVLAGSVIILSGWSPASAQVTGGSGQGSQLPSPTAGRQPAPTRPAADTGGAIVAVWAIQVGAFADSGNAARLSANLRAKGLEPVVYDNLIDGRRLLHLVWVGRFDTPQEAIPEIARIEELTGIRGVLREQQVWRKKK